MSPKAANCDCAIPFIRLNILVTLAFPIELATFEAPPLFDMILDIPSTCGITFCNASGTLLPASDIKLIRIFGDTAIPMDLINDTADCPTVASLSGTKLSIK